MTTLPGVEFIFDRHNILILSEEDRSLIFAPYGMTKFKDKGVLVVCCIEGQYNHCLWLDEEKILQVRDAIGNLHLYPLLHGEGYVLSMYRHMSLGYKLNLSVTGLFDYHGEFNFTLSPEQWEQFGKVFGCPV